MATPQQQPRKGGNATPATPATPPVATPATPPVAPATPPVAPATTLAQACTDLYNSAVQGVATPASALLAAVASLGTRKAPVATHPVRMGFTGTGSIAQVLLNSVASMPPGTTFTMAQLFGMHPATAGLCPTRQSRHNLMASLVGKGVLCVVGGRAGALRGKVYGKLATPGSAPSVNANTTGTVGTGTPATT